MPKKGKKGGGKTEEEKLLYLQQRAQAEEELAKKKEEILTLFLKVNINVCRRFVVCRLSCSVLYEAENVKTTLLLLF